MSENVELSKWKNQNLLCMIQTYPVICERGSIMHHILKDSSGYFSAETAIVISVIILIITTGILFYISLFTGIDTFCDGAEDYTGFLPPDIHRVTTVVIETGGDIIEKIS